jgi:hypothetical protein
METGIFRQGAFRALRDIATCRLDDADRKTMLAIGFNPEDVRQVTFHDPAARDCALQRLGDGGSPEALDFLQNLKPEDLLTGYSEEERHRGSVQGLPHNAKDALNHILLNRITDLPGKVHFLEDLAGRRSWWAANQLCDLGIQTSLPVIHNTLSTIYSGGYHGETEFRFCEERIRVLSRDPDRIKALGSVLRTDPPPDFRLVSWAVRQLAGLRDPQADLRLMRYGLEIHFLPERSEARHVLSIVDSEIDTYMERRKPLSQPIPAQLKP